MQRTELTNISDFLCELNEDKNEFDINYKDEDILLIDNIRLLNKPESIFVKMNVVACCQKGRIEAKTQDGTITVCENELFVCRPNQIIEQIMISPDLECGLIFITNNGLRNILGQHMQLWTKTVIVNKLNKIRLNATDMEYYYHFYNILNMTVNAKDDAIKNWAPYRQDIVQQIVKFGLLGLCNALAEDCNNDLPEKANADNAFSRFMDLLENTTQKHQPVEYFADKLCITPKYLTVLSKKYSDKTAQEWIREYTLTDITYYLQHTSMSMKEVAAAIGFPNTSFFGKYVKTYLGMTPKQYREKSADSQDQNP